MVLIAVLPVYKNKHSFVSCLMYEAFFFPRFFLTFAPNAPLLMRTLSPCEGCSNGTAGGRTVPEAGVPGIGGASHDPRPLSPSAVQQAS